MFQSLFCSKRESVLGIDAGTFSIRVVHLSYSQKKDVKLENYGEKFNEIDKENLYKNIRKKTFFSSHEEISKDIKKILDKAKIKERKAVFSIPDFMTFFTIFKIPFMSEEEMNSAVQFEAKQHVPMPLKDVFLDWSVVEKQNKETKKGSKIILVAVPNKIVEEYKKIAGLSGIELLAIEAEVFSLARTLLNGESDEKIIQLIDVGVQSSTINIIEKGVMKSVFSVDFSESGMMKNLAGKLSMSYNEVEEIKEKGGFSENSDEGRVMCSQLDDLINETERVADNFYRTEKKNIDKIILSGGLVLTPGFKDYFEKKTGKESFIINPFSNISYNSVLEEDIKKIGPRYAIAVGLALRNRK